jgi:DNA-binding LacI/PurR family transcriptional regulator
VVYSNDRNLDYIDRIEKGNSLLATAGKIITQKTIAERLNLHPTTVSMALRDVKLISPATRKRVLKMARELNYQPNILARNLRMQSSNMLGIIVPSNVWIEVLQERIAATARLAHQESLDLMTYYRWPEEHTYEKSVRSLRCAQVAGLIVSHMNEPTIPEALQDWVNEDRPIVFLSDNGRESFNTIDTDRVEGFRMATEYLARLGHRELAIILPERGEGIVNPGDQLRLEGFRKGLVEAGLPFHPESVIRYQKSSEEGIAKAMAQLAGMHPRPTALLTFSDETAAPCIRELMRLGLNVPKDISVMGFDDSLISRSNLIPISTLAQPVEELSKLTIQKLVEMIRGEGSRRFRSILCPPKLIVRETTAPPSNQ